MDERISESNGGEAKEQGNYFLALRSNWWKAAIFSLLVGAATLIALLRVPAGYRANAVITSAVEDRRNSSTLGVLSTFGVDLGNPSKVEDLETLFKSDDLSVRVFNKYDLWPIIFGERFDAKNGKLKFAWPDRILWGEKVSRSPNEWDAIRAARARLKVQLNRRSGTISISFESSSAESSSKILAYFLEEGKDRLQEEALNRATKNKLFIAEQISKTVDPLARDRLYSLFGQELEREMMARNREQFGFRVIDSPRASDRPTGPQRVEIVLTVMVMAFFLAVTWFLYRNRNILA